MFMCVTLITTPFLNSHMVVYLELIEVWGRESGGGVFQCLISSIKVSVTTSDVVGKCRTDVFVSVFCDTRDSMDFTHNTEGLRDSAVSLYFLEIPHFTLVEGPKVFKDKVWNIYSASQKLYTFFVCKISYAVNYKAFLEQIIQLFDFFHIFTISWQSSCPGVFAC